MGSVRVFIIYFMGVLRVSVVGKCADEGRVIVRGVAPVTTLPEFVIEIDW